MEANYLAATNNGRPFKAVLCSLPTESPDAFVTPRVPSSSGPNRIVKMGIVALIKWMEKHGYTRENYDYYDVDTLLPSDEKLKDYFRRIKPDVVGLSAVVSTSYMQVKRISRIIRETAPDAWIVVGGNLASSANVVLAKTDADVCVYGDGEIAWVAFLDYARKHGRQWAFDELWKVPGLVYYNKNRELCFNGQPPKIPDEEMVLPDYDIHLMGLQGRSEKLACYFGKGAGDFFGAVDPRSFESGRRPNMALMPTSKGCVAKCTFCQRVFKGYRTIDLEKIEEHVKMLQEKFNVGFISFADENFGSDKEFAYAVAGIMKKYDVLWSGGGTRVSSIKPEDVRFFKEHNCLGFTFGIESGSPRMLDVLEKRFTTDTLMATLDTCIELEMNAPMNFLTGMPGETEETSMETGRLIGEIAYKIGVPPKDLGVAVAYAMPFPGTPLYEYAQQKGVIGEGVDEEEAYLIRIGRARVNKFNYININGAHEKEVLFWDYLIKMEASRRFRGLRRKKPRAPGKLGQSLSQRTRRISNKVLSSGGNPLINLRRMFLLNIEDNRLYDRLPRWIIYPLIKNILYIDHRIKRFIFHRLGKEYTFGTEKIVPPRIPDDYFRGRASREASLRWIVHAERTKPQTQTDKALFALRSVI